MPLALTQPLPLEEAIRRVQSRTPVASQLTSAQWQDVALGLRERAFWSARIQDIRTVSALQGGIQEAIDLSSRDRERAFMSRDKFVADMRQQLGSPEGDTGALTDINSARRLKLVYDFNVEDAMEHARWQIGQDPDSLAAAPAQELVRVEEREDKRDWKKIWQDAGGRLFDGRMVAKKGDPVWERISDFGRPWPPFKWGSGMGVEDVFVDEAEELGVMQPGEAPPQPQVRDFNDKLEASVANLSESARASLQASFGDQIRLEGGTAKWRGSLLDDLFDRALRDPQPKGKVDLGEATARAVELGREAGVDLAGQRLQITASDVRHIVQGHGAGAALRPGEQPFTRQDLRMLPWIWRQPDTLRLSQGQRAGRPVLEMQKKDFGQLWTVAWQREPKAGLWQVLTAYRSPTGEKWPA